MQVADEQTVRGNFDDVTFTHRDVTTTFFRRDGKFFVRTDGPDGATSTTTKSPTPLVSHRSSNISSRSPARRYQALGIAWNSRPAGRGWAALVPSLS